MGPWQILGSLHQIPCIRAGEGVALSEGRRAGPRASLGGGCGARGGVGQGGRRRGAVGRGGRGGAGGRCGGRRAGGGGGGRAAAARRCAGGGGREGPAVCGEGGRRLCRCPVTGAVFNETKLLLSR